MRKKHFPYTIAALLWAGCILCTGCGNGAVASSMRLTKAEGTVAVSDAKGKNISPEEDLKLYDGYYLETESRSFAWITLDDTKLSKMDSESEASIQKHGDDLEIILDSGSIYFNITEPLSDDETLNIRTSNMAVGIRGTCGWVEIIDRRRVMVCILEGTVECSLTDPVSGETLTATVSDGELAKTVISPDGAEGEKCALYKRPLTAGDIPDYIWEELKQDRELREKIIAATDEDILNPDAAPAEGSVYDPEQETQWQNASLELLSSVRRQNEGLSGDEIFYAAAREYGLYDIDKDGIPELLLRYGDSEAAIHTELYAFRDGAYRNLGEIGSGHTSYYTWPGENGLAVWWGHMGYSSIGRLMLNGNDISTEPLIDEDINGNPDAAYTEPDAFAEGSHAVNFYRVALDMPVAQYRSGLNGSYGRPAKEDPENETVRARLLSTMSDNGTVRGISADGFSDDTGEISFEEYLTGIRMAVQKYAWADVNNDGRIECVLCLTAADPAYSYYSDIYVALSLQEDTVYAYRLNYFSGTVLQNGVFNANYGGGARMIFDGEECYMFQMYTEETAGEVTWETP